jgi:hypothetical protein
MTAPGRFLSNFGGDPNDRCQVGEPTFVLRCDSQKQVLVYREALNRNHQPLLASPLESIPPQIRISLIVGNRS